jgi:DNA repair ATPase RecN
MVTKGAFGYIIGKKKRIMSVNDDADLLWQILVREIYVLMKHFKTKEELQNAFEKIIVAKNKPKAEQIDHCKCFADFENDDGSWSSILRHCQSSFINILEAGHILNEKNDIQDGHIFLLDFNKGEVVYYFKDYNGKDNEIDSAKIEEIMMFDEMPSKNYTEIVSEMRHVFSVFYENITSVRNEIDKLNNLLVKSKQQGAANIEEKVDKLLYEMKMEQQKLNVGRRVFYKRLKALDLIVEDETK